MNFRKPVAITLTAAAITAGIAAGTATASAEPVALQPVATNPDAQNHDPLANGAAAGAGIGAGVGAGLAALGTSPVWILLPGLGSAIAAPAILTNALFYGAIGAGAGVATGAIAPDVVPQVLP